MENNWQKGIFDVVVGDALGEPVQFESRETVATHPVKGMRGNGTFNLPKGSWTDDSSLTLALLDAINKKDGIDLQYIMRNFVDWLDNGKFTPYGYSYDIGRGTILAIEAYKRSHNSDTCGGREEWNNGNGSLMRIIPACIYCCEKQLTDDEAVKVIHSVASLTHGHIRANIACGLYYFMVKEVIYGEGTLNERLQKGLDNGFAYYEMILPDDNELSYFDRLRDLDKLAQTSVDDIKSSGYVVDTIEASIWSLVTTDSYKNALLRAVNLGLDTDTIGAIAGGLAGLFYGINDDNGVPSSWIEDVQKNGMIEEMCRFADSRWNQHIVVKK